MKKNILIILTLVALGFIVFYFYKSTRSQLNVEKTNQLSQVVSDSSKNIKETNSFSLKSYTQLPKKDPREPFNKNDPRWAEWERRKKEDRNWEWKMPINFYGKVIDENNQPVEGAIIKLQWNDTSVKGTSYGNTKSDADGLFSLTGEEGKLLQIQVSKEGYYGYRNERIASFEYAAFFDPQYHIPDPNNPVVFHLRKKGEPAELIYRDILYGIKIDGTPHYIDLVSGQKFIGSNPTGDLMVQIIRVADNTNPKKFDWSAILQGVGDGGLIETNSEFMFEAPVEGYQTKIEYRKEISDPEWKREIEKNFYIRSRNGKVYARIEANIIPKYQNSASIRIKSYVNPNGSRNLEFDKTKIIKPK